MQHKSNFTYDEIHFVERADDDGNAVLIIDGLRLPRGVLERMWWNLRKFHILPTFSCDSAIAVNCFGERTVCRFFLSYAHCKNAEEKALCTKRFAETFRLQALALEEVIVTFLENGQELIPTSASPEEIDTAVDRFLVGINIRPKNAGKKRGKVRAKQLA